MQFSARTAVFSANILQELDALRQQLQKEGKEVINLSVGTPDLPPDSHVIQAMATACQNPENYKYSLGDLPTLIAAVQSWYARRYHVQLADDEIMSVYGSQEGIAHVAFPLCDVGDTVLVTDPGYPIFSFGPLLAGAKLVKLPLREENGYLIDFDAIDPQIAREARVIVVSYPNNPVTATANRAFYQRLVAFAKQYDIIVVHDNAYSELVYQGQPGGSFLEVEGAKEVGVEFNSLSKSYNLTGSRISFCLGNREIIRRFKALRSQIDYGIFYPVQYAAIAALEGPQDILDRGRQAYRERSHTLCKGLREIGWQVPDAEATMFTWFAIPEAHRRQGSMDFCMKLLERAGVICVPGISFGSLGEGYVRMALVQPPEQLRRAIEKIAASGLV